MSPHVSVLRNPKFWYVCAIIWAIIAAIGFVILLLSSSSPQLFSLAEIFSVIGALGSWLSILTGATIWGQNEMLRRQDETLRRQDETLRRQDETLLLLRESMLLLREIRDAIRK